MNTKNLHQRNKHEVPMLCSYCGRVLKGQDVWEKKANTENNIHEWDCSHGICPDCLLMHYPLEYLTIQEEKRVRIKNIFKRGYQELYGHLVK